MERRREEGGGGLFGVRCVDLLARGLWCRGGFSGLAPRGDNVVVEEMGGRLGS